MPETPNPKSRQPLAPPTRVAHSGYAYAELDVTSNFSFLRGASHPDELVYQAAELGYRAIAITDRHTLAGAVRAHAAAKSCGMKLIVGARLPLMDGPELVVWAPDRAAYARLCSLLTLGKRRTEKGQCALKTADFLGENKGMLVGIDLQDTSNATAEAPSRRERRREGVLDIHSRRNPLRLGASAVASYLDDLHDALGDGLSLLVSRAYHGDDTSHLRRLI